MRHWNRLGSPGSLPDPDILLPAGDMLLCAIRGQVDDWTPLTRRARQLGALYRQLITHPADSGEVRVRIGLLSTEIDRRVAAHLPRPRPGALLLICSVGGVISTVAEAHAGAFWALEHHPAGDIRMLRTWEHLAEMHNAYTAFRESVLAGSVALPKAWPGIESVETLDRGPAPTFGEAL